MDVNMAPPGCLLGSSYGGMLEARTELIAEHVFCYSLFEITVKEVDYSQEDFLNQRYNRFYLCKNHTMLGFEWLNITLYKSIMLPLVLVFGVPIK